MKKRTQYSNFSSDLDKFSLLDKLTYNNFEFNQEKFLNTKSEQYRITEYTLILLFIIIGGIFLMSSNDLISLFLSVELQSYGLYILSSVYRNSELSTLAVLTYFLLGFFSFCFILLSTSLSYANSGWTPCFIVSYLLSLVIGAVLTYFLLGFFSFCFILLSTSLLYANSGCTSLYSLFIITNILETFKQVTENNFLSSVYRNSEESISAALTYL